MTQPPHIAAALAYANDEATPAQLASLGRYPDRAALAFLASCVGNPDAKAGNNTAAVARIKELSARRRKRLPAPLAQTEGGQS